MWLTLEKLLSFILHISMFPGFLEQEAALIDCCEKVYLAFSVLETCSFSILVGKYSSENFQPISSTLMVILTNYKDKEITPASHADKYFASFLILQFESRIQSHQCFKIQDKSNCKRR